MYRGSPALTIGKNPKRASGALFPRQNGDGKRSSPDYLRFDWPSLFLEVFQDFFD
jgi:hypothetical protein